MLTAAIKQIFAWMTLQNLSAELARAQIVELRRQIPLLYLLLSLNTVAAAYTHTGFAPRWLTVWIPVGLVAFSVFRYLIWRHRRTRTASGDRAVTLLRRATAIGFVLAAIFIAWALTLSHYGGEHEHAHIAVYIGITAIGCIFCLFPLPQSAVTTTVTVVVPYLVYSIVLSSGIFYAIAVNIVLVIFVMMLVLFNNYRSFSELVRLNQEVTILSQTDPLTNLANRRHFFQELAARYAVLDEHEGDGGPSLYVGIMDLDCFKAVNDSYGHAVGDELIRQIGGRLHALFAGRGLVARLGGDEFAFLTDLDHAQTFALAVEACRVITQPVPVGETMLSLGASCGLARHQNIPGGAIQLYKAADYALYVSKTDRRGSVTMYSPEHARLVETERTFAAALQNSDLERELHIVMQPIINGDTGTVMAVEALARWTSPAMGIVSPALFIPLAERIGMIHRVTLVLFRKALECARRLPPDIQISFNLSAHDLTSADTIREIARLIDQTPGLSRKPIFELTETALMRDFAAAEASIELLKSVGACIALDDFGTGYSSLEYLRRLPIDKVKIDRGFVIDIEKPGGRDMLAGIFGLCDRIGMKCIAEGVEDEAQYRTLRELGCRSFQGFYFAAPMPVDDFLSWNDARDQGARWHRVRAVGL